jgi:cytochrome c oxidase subunit 2
VIVLVAAAYSWVILDRIEAREPDRLQVGVTAQQFAWKFEYPEQGVTSTELHVPVDRQVEFSMEALDVIHSFWVPEWRMKKDVVPGLTTHITATPDREGSYSLICTELCGIGHSTMRAPVVVETQEEFDAWIGKQEGDAGAGGAGGPAGETGGAAEEPSQEAAAGEQIFTESGCSGCHTLAAAGSTADIGPSLDESIPQMSPEEIEEAIIEPDAELAQGFGAGIMPDTFDESLDDEQLQALVAYLTESTAGTK